MNKEDLIKEAMRELGRKSAEARKKKYGKDYMKELSAQGVAARKKKTEPLDKAKPKTRTVQKTVAKKGSILFDI